jgi:hypothetical protein
MHQHEWQIADRGLLAVQVQGSVVHECGTPSLLDGLQTHADELATDEPHPKCFSNRTQELRDFERRPQL